MSEFLRCSCIIAFSMYETGNLELCNMVLEFSYGNISKMKYQPLESLDLLHEKESFEKRWNSFLCLCKISTKWKWPTWLNWKESVGPSLWHWIHIVTLHLDLNAGYIEKKNFVIIVQGLIACSECNSHYRWNRDILLAMLEYYSISDVYLKFHSYISQLLQEAHLKTVILFENASIDQSYRRNYLMEYLNLTKDKISNNTD